MYYIFKILRNLHSKTKLQNINVLICSVFSVVYGKLNVGSGMKMRTLHAHAALPPPWFVCCSGK